MITIESMYAKYKDLMKQYGDASLEIKKHIIIILCWKHMKLALSYKVLKLKALEMATLV
mgnify:CR=1 FL=1